MVVRRAFVVAPLALVLALATLVLPRAEVASAQTSVQRTKSASTFTLNPRKNRVDVKVKLAITNQTPSTVRVGPCSGAPSRTCRVTTNYVTSSWGFLAIQHGARKIKLRGPGVSARIDHKNKTYTNYRLGFSPIRRGQTANITVTYQLPAAKPRSGDPTRITDAYAHFCWHGQPTKTGTVTAILPGDYEPSTQHANVKTRRSGNKVKLGPKRKGNPGKTYACTDSVDTDEVIETQTVSPSGQVVTVQGWPEDPGWSEAVTESVETTLPALEALIGAPIPGDGLTIIEVPSQALGNYAGDFSTVSGNVRVSEDTDDPVVVTHELAHAWFNDRSFDGKWMMEGGAEWAARQVNGLRCNWRARPSGDEEVPKLRKWRLLSPDATDAQQKYVSAQYFTACDIYERVEDLIGEEGFRAMNAALLGRTPKYGGTRKPKPPKPDWREWLDAADELGMVPAGRLPSTLLEDELVENGIARPKELKGRNDARGAYHRWLRGTHGDYMPIVIRDLMDAWRFDKATAALATADAIMSAAATYDSENDASVTPVVGARLANAKSLPALRRLRKAVDSDPSTIKAPETTTTATN